MRFQLGVDFIWAYKVLYCELSILLFIQKTFGQYEEFDINDWLKLFASGVQIYSWDITSVYFSNPSNKLFNIVNAINHDKLIELHWCKNWL